MKWVFTTITGLFVTDDQFSIIDHKPFSGQDYSKHTQILGDMLKKHPDIKSANMDQHRLFLPKLKNPKYFSMFHESNLAEAVSAVRASVNEDALITQAIGSINDLDRASNTLLRRLREWYELYMPEFSASIQNNEIFIELIQEKSRRQLLEQLKLSENSTMGSDLKEEDLKPVLVLASQISAINELKEKQLSYLEKIMVSYCRNLNELCGTSLGAKLLSMAGSLKRLALLPSSTIQLFGAEKALFRHLTRKSRPPKHGIILNHPFVQNAPKQRRGKAARMLADKISMCARLDYFKGGFLAPKYKKELEEKLR